MPGGGGLAEGCRPASGDGGVHPPTPRKPRRPALGEGCGSSTGAEPRVFFCASRPRPRPGRAGPGQRMRAPRPRGAPSRPPHRWGRGGGWLGPRGESQATLSRARQKKRRLRAPLLTRWEGGGDAHARFGRGGGCTWAEKESPTQQSRVGGGAARAGASMCVDCREGAKRRRGGISRARGFHGCGG